MHRYAAQHPPLRSVGETSANRDELVAGFGDEADGFGEEGVVAGRADLADEAVGEALGELLDPRGRLGTFDAAAALVEAGAGRRRTI